mgnify:FL=1
MYGYFQLVTVAIKRFINMPLIASFKLILLFGHVKSLSEDNEFEERKSHCHLFD